MSDPTELNDDEQTTDRQRSSKSLLRFALHSAWRFRILILVATGIGMAFGLYRSLIIPDQYGSVGKLFVRPGIRDTITPESAFATDGGIARMSSREAILSEMQILASPQLYQTAVKILGPDTLLAPFNPNATDAGSDSWLSSLIRSFQSWHFKQPTDVQPVSEAMRSQVASMLLSRAANIYPDLGARVISFNYVADSPGKAQAVVNALLSAAIEVHSDVFKSMSSIKTIEEERKSAEGIARAAEEALRTFHGSKGIYDFEQQRDALLVYLNDIEKQLNDGAVDAARKGAEVELLNDLKKTTDKDRLIQGSASFVLNPAYSALNTLLIQLQLRSLDLDAQKSTFATADFKRRKEALDAVTKDVTTRLSNESLQLKLEGGREANPHYQSLEQSLHERAIELKGLAKQKVQLEAIRKATKDRLNEFEALYPDLQRLELEATQKRATADRLAAAVSNLRAVQRLEQLNLSNIQVMHQATFEPERIGPRRTQRVLLAGIIGGLIGFGLGFLISLRDPIIRTRYDLMWLGIKPDEVLDESDPHQQTSYEWKPDALPESYEPVREEIARAWSALPYDRRSRDALRIAFVPCGNEVDPSRAAAILAIGLAALGGEKVAYVSCAGDDGWLARRLEFGPASGWSEVLSGKLELERALVKTDVQGLDYLPIGDATNRLPHPMTGPNFVALLDRLCTTHRFVIVELPNITKRPEGQSVLNVIDGTQLVAISGKTQRATLRSTKSAVTANGSQLIGAVLQDGRS